MKSKNCKKMLDEQMWKKCEKINFRKGRTWEKSSVFVGQAWPDLDKWHY